MILERPDQKKEVEAGNRGPASTGHVSEDPPAYSQAVRSTTTSGTSPSQVVRQGEVPFSAPINGLQMYTRRGAIRGSWSLDPSAPQVPAQDLVQMVLEGRGEKKRLCGFRCSKKKETPTESALRPVATIRSKSRGGNIFLDVTSIAPTRTVQIDAHSRRGDVSLLIPRNFSGLLQISSRHGAVEMLPALAASARVIRGRKKETTILLGDAPMPAVGSDAIVDTARIYSRRGRVSVGFSGEDYVVESPGLMDQAIKMMQKLITPSSHKFP